MIPITEDELTTFIHQKLARTDFSKSVKDLIPEARRLARLMLAAEQMYKALKEVTGTDVGLGRALLHCERALSAAEGRK